MTPYLDQARRLHRYLVNHHWDGRALTGPDSGVRLNYRVGRFVKSYLPFVPWRDSLYYLQGQGYWVLANWLLADLTADERPAAIAVQASDEMLSRRRPDGSWAYPNPAWAGRTATGEGTWAALGLLESFRRTKKDRFLAGAVAWHDFLERSIGYRPAPGGSAAHYFATPGEPVPNISTMVLWFLAELAALGVEVGPGRQEQLLSFVRAVQRPNGELPYALPSTDHADDGREHFQCFQYNAFQCLDLIAYHQLTADAAALDVIRGLAGFVKSGVSDEGYLYYDCRRRRRAVVYHAAAAAAALSRATAVGAVDAAPEAEAAYRWVLAQQRHDGGFPFSHVEFNVLRDRRSYPRNLAMILQHLLVART